MTYETARAPAETSTTRTGAATGSIEIRLVSDAAEWNALVATCPEPHLTQGFAYGEGKAATGWTVKRAAFLLAGRPVAVATVLEFRPFGLHLINRINRGPLFLEPEPAEQRVAAVLGAIRRRWGRLWTAPLLIAPSLPRGEKSNAILGRLGFLHWRELSWRSGRIDLTRSEDEIWTGFGPTFRNRVRKAEKAGAALRIADDAETFDWMVARHQENMAEKGFSAASPTLLQALRRADPQAVLVFQLMHRSAPVAGMSVVRFGAVAEYHIGWFGPEGRQLNAGNYLMWNVMRELKRRGATRFDVGGMREGDGYTRFKQTMNPVEYELAGEWISF